MNSPTLHLFRGTLRDTTDESRRLHNAFADGGPASVIAIAQSLGDLSHNAYTSLDEPREVLRLDFWSGADGMQRLSNYMNSSGRLATIGW